MLSDRLTHVYRYIGSFDAVRIDKHGWFLPSRRPTVAEDALSCYRLPHKTVLLAVAAREFSFNISNLY